MIFIFRAMGPNLKIGVQESHENEHLYVKFIEIGKGIEAGQR